MSVGRKSWGMVAVGLLLTIASSATAKYSGGTGEPNDPYQIATAADLIALGETPADYDKHFILTADIDLDPNLPGGKVFDRAVIAPDTNDAPSSWFEGTAFTGVFDGNGHTISHLTIRGGSCLGLFGQLVGDWFRPGSAGQVKNLGVVDVSIIGTGDLVGGLAGYDDSGTVTQCYSSGVVSGNSWVGGLVGMESSPTPGLPPLIITYCYSNCYSTAAVSAATRSAGGLVGYNSCGAIIRCYSTGPVSAPVGAGGLVGEGDVIVTDCFWDIETSGQAASAGGTGKTTQEMQAASTLVQWGACVSVWTIDDGRDYPRLAWENAPGQIIAGPTYAGGTGTAEDPYLIATAGDLNALGLCSCHWGRHFTLTADIDLSGRTWTGSVVPSFWGVFDGNGHIISGLTITGTGRLGLFGGLAGGAYVKDLGVVDVNIISSGNSVGGLVGENYGSIVASYSTGAVSGHQWVGGLVGMHEAGDVSRCYSTCGVSGAWDVGGLVGYNYAGTVTQCYSAGSVRGNSSVGGLVGANGGTVTNCYSVGPVSGAGQVGGLVGSGSPKGAMHCVWDVETCGLTSSGGGMGLRTGEMMDPNVLALNGFAEDPNWVLDARRDYPRLAWEGRMSTIIPEPSFDWLEGQGTAEEPYRIGTADQLILLGKASVLWDGHFVLDADIDLDPNLAEGTVFGQAVILVFSGVFDGGGHAISHLTIRGGSYLGLFGWVSDPNSEIRNLSLIDPNVHGVSYVGALAGWIEGGMVANCRVVDANVFGTGLIRELGYPGLVGGLTASHENGTITDCSVLGGCVSGASTVSTVGGLVGNGGRIIRCSVEQVEVVCTRDRFVNVGGLAATAKEVVDCHVTGGLVRGREQVGGLVARMVGGTISRCYTSTRVEAAEKASVAGLHMGTGGRQQRDDRELLLHQQRNANQPWHARACWRTGGL
jgi:hypothetical protein